MNKILIISDSHGTNDFTKIIKHENPDLTLHAGDVELTKNNNALKDVDYIVIGNCDFENFKEYILVDKFQRKILLTHGHLFKVKSSLDSLYYFGEQNSANIIIYGHTHVEHIEKVQNTLILNPGSTAYGRGNVNKSYILLEIHNNKYIVHLKDSKTFKCYSTFEFNT